MLRHFRCSSANTANMIGSVTSAVRDTTTNAMLTKKLNAIARQQQRLRDPLCPQQRDDRVGQRDRAQREFLALGDVVLDEDAACSRRLVGRLQRKTGMEKRLSRTSPSAACRRRGTRRTPTCRASSARNDRTGPGAPGASRRTHGIEPRAPGRVRPQGSDQRQNEQARSAARRSGASARPESPSVERRRNRDAAGPRRGCPPATSTMAATTQAEPRRYRLVFIQAAGSRQTGSALADRRRSGSPAHALPPRARSTSDVVLWPGRMSTSTTSPPAASTISWPTTCSRV